MSIPNQSPRWSGNDARETAVAGTSLALRVCRKRPVPVSISATIVNLAFQEVINVSRVEQNPLGLAKKLPISVEKGRA